MDSCRDALYQRQWKKALKAASGTTQTLYVLGHMMENPIKVFPKGDDSINKKRARWGDGNGRGSGFALETGSGNGCGFENGDCYGDSTGNGNAACGCHGNGWGEENGDFELPNGSWAD